MSGARVLVALALAITLARHAASQTPSSPAPALPLDSCGGPAARIDTVIDTLFAWIPLRTREVTAAEHAFVTAQIRAVLALIPPMPLLLDPARGGIRPISRGVDKVPREALFVAWFQVRNDGRLVGLSVRNRSGWDTLDNALARAILRADSQRTLRPLEGELANQGIDLYLAVGSGRRDGMSNHPVTRYRSIYEGARLPTPPRLLRVGHQPRFPDAAVRAGVGDSLIFEFEIDTTGHPVRESIVPVQAGFRDFLDESVRAIMSARFEPARIGICKVSTRVVMPLTFRVRP